MDFLSFKKRSNKKLSELMESLIDGVVIPKNAFSMSLENGSFTVKPFGKYTYYFEVLFNDEQKYATFLDSFKKSKLFDSIEDVKFYEDKVIKFYKVSGFISAAVVEELELELKEFLTKKITKKEIDVESIKDKITKV